MSITLFPDQTESLDNTVASMRRGNKAVLLQAPTGFGKSVVGSTIVKRAFNKGSRTWFIVPRRDLIRQMSKTYYGEGLSHSFIASGRHFDQKSQTFICSADTLKGRLRELDPPNLAIIDETHYGGEGLDSIIQWLKANGSYIIGLSATPWKLSGQGLGCWYDDMVQAPSIRWLIDNKRLCDYEAYAPSTPDLSRIKTVGGEYAKGQIQDWARNNRKRIGDAAGHYLQHGEGRLGIAYCVGIEDSMMTAQMFCDAGIPAAHLDGNTPDDEKERIIRAYANRELRYLCNAELLTFGFDLSGNTIEHLMPCAERDWTLEDREKKGRAGDGERSIPVRQCPKCFRSHYPKSSCPNCGYEYPVQARKIEDVEGQLQKITDVSVVEKKEKRMEVVQAKTLDDLRKIAKERGYNPYWANIMAKKKGIIS